MRLFPKDHKLIWTLLLLNLFLVYFYTFYILLNYDLPWMVYEQLRTHLWILANGSQWHWSDLAKALNTKVIEIDPNRLSRPLANLVEVIDAKFRANLWNYVPPHPTLSVQWPFLFIGLPFIFYKFFRNIHCHAVVALAGTSLYLTSSGFLSPIVMVSHPAKGMVNFFGILSLYLLSKFYRKMPRENVSIKTTPHFWPILICCWWVMIITFLFDETGLFLFVMLGVLGFSFFMKFKEKSVLLGFYLSFPAVYFLIIHYLLPWLHLLVNGREVDLSQYRDFPHISRLFWPNWHNFFINCYLLFSVHPALRWDFHPIAGHPFLIGLQCIYTLGFLFLMGLLIYGIYRSGKFSPRVKQILAAFIVMIIFIFFHTFQLSHNVRVWPVFWYGCLFSLTYYITLTLVLQYVWEEFKGRIFKGVFPLLIFIFTVHGLMTSTYLEVMFKNQGDNPAKFPYPYIFSGGITPYPYFDLSQSIQQSRCRYLFTLMLWSQVKNKNIDRDSVVRQLQQDSCPSVVAKDTYFQLDLFYFMIEGAFQFPPGHSFLNDPDYVSRIIRMVGEPP